MSVELNLVASDYAMDQDKATILMRVAAAQTVSGILDEILWASTHKVTIHQDWTDHSHIYRIEVHR